MKGPREIVTSFKRKMDPHPGQGQRSLAPFGFFKMPRTEEDGPLYSVKQIRFKWKQECCSRLWKSQSPSCPARWFQNGRGAPIEGGLPRFEEVDESEEAMSTDGTSAEEDE